MLLEIGLPILIFIAAALYAAVGHAGASGYLAAMALFGLAPAEMKPAALTLNILVASIATVKYVRAGFFSMPLFWPLALLAIPAAFIGGRLQLPSYYYKPLIGIVLIYAAWRLVWKPQVSTEPVRRGRLGYLIVAGACIGLMSGLTGVGGGIFLSPLLLFAGWATARESSGVAAPFILVNSLAALLGLMSTNITFPDAMPVWAIAAVAGGYLGADYGSKRLASPAILSLLACALIIAGIKMLLT